MNMNTGFNPAYGHNAGDQLSCLSLAIEVEKEDVLDAEGKPSKRVGFRIGGGIDLDPSKAPVKYPDNGIYITTVEPNSPAQRAGLKQHDKILQVCGYDLTMVTHDKAVKYIKKYDVLRMLIARQGVNFQNS